MKFATKRAQLCLISTDVKYIGCWPRKFINNAALVKIIKSHWLVSILANSYS